MKKINNSKNYNNLLNKKNKTFNPFNNDEDWDIVDKNLPIKEKSKNPFWVPEKNSEIFEVREVLKQEKEKKRFITRAKRQKENTREKEYNTVLHDGKTSFYLTEQRFPDISRRKIKETQGKDENYNNNSEYLDTMSNLDNKTGKGNGNLNNLGIKILERIKEKKDRENYDNSEKIQSEKLQEKINTINNKKKDNVRDYITKTRDIILTKYTTEIKKERAIRMEETYQNEIEAIKDSIMTMKEMKKLFEEDFFLRFESYVRHLRNQREREKNELNNLLDEGNHLDIDIVKLENRILKEKEKLIQYIEYRDFLICIKERRITLPDFFTKIAKNGNNVISGVNNDNININEIEGNNDNNDPINQNPENVDVNRAKNKKPSMKNWFKGFVTPAKKVIEIQVVKEETEIDRYKRYLKKPIFDSAEELNDEIKKMELENINLLEKLNTNRININSLNRELKKDEEKETKIEEIMVKDIQETQNLVNILKEKNTKLIEEKNYLSNEKMFNQTRTEISKINMHMHQTNKTSNNLFSAMSQTTRDKRPKNISFTKNKFGQSILYGKIHNIFQGCLEMDLNKKIVIDKENTVLFMLKKIEKSLDFLLERQDYYLSDPINALEWDKKKNELDKKRKIRKAEENKYLEENKREQLKLDIYERNNRVLVIPKKKYGNKFRPIDKSKEKKNIKKKETDSDLLFY